ncbi:MAG: hypothetical protein QM775_34495 [Pirellulales bacterium]
MLRTLLQQDFVSARLRVAASAWWLIVVLFTAATAGAQDDVAAYEAVWSDGTRTTSPTPLEWINQEHRPTLGQRSPTVGENPLLRLRTVVLAQPADLGGRIELAGGDRLPGRIIEFLPASAGELRRPDCLVVEPLVAPDQPTPDVPVRVHVPVERIRRVVWEERTPRLYRSNTLHYRDGRQTTFRSLRWNAGGVRLLVEQGVEEIPWDEIAEVQLAERDPWEEYADELALLTPDLTSKLVRFETTGGVRLTTSLERILRDGRRQQAGDAVARHAAGMEFGRADDSNPFRHVANLLQTARRAALGLRTGRVLA